jgi:hypothetical protein
MFQIDNQPPPQKHITTGDIIWIVVSICIGFLLIYTFYLLFTNLTESTLYREILHR